MDWIGQVRLIAETDRVLQARQRRKHKRWTSKQTAKRLGIQPSKVSMCLRLDEALEQWPIIKTAPSLRAAYDECQILKRAGALHASPA